jgi:hypothetical protein
MRCFHVNVSLIADHRTLGVDPEKRWAINSKARARNKEDEHPLPIPAVASNLVPLLDEVESFAKSVQDSRRSLLFQTVAIGLSSVMPLASISRASAR